MIPKTHVSDDLARKAREIQHHRQVAAISGETWAGNTPAGRERLRRRIVLFESLGFLSPNSRVLEIGCGIGTFTEELAKTQIRLISVDLSEDLVREALKKTRPHPLRFSVQDVEHLAFPDGNFDSVIGVSILHHLRVESALSEIHRVLKSGGRFIFSEPNYLNPQVFIERAHPLLRRLTGTSPDETAFLRWQLKRKLLDQGFEQIWVKPFDFLHPNTPRFAIPAVQSLGRLLERTPLIREIAGSLIIYGRKPS